MKTTFLALACLVVSSSHGQITLENTAAEPLRSMLSLSDGPKLREQQIDGGVLNIYNLDLSVYRTLNIPAAPEGYAWNGNPYYITESLFDNDPATIEFLLGGSGIEDSLTFSFVLGVYREDGTPLFEKFPGMLFAAGGMSDLDFGPAIFETPSGAKMVVQEAFGAPTELYALPGHVPCISACQPNAELHFSIGVNEVMAFMGSLSVQSPALNSALLRYTLPAGVTGADLSVFDQSGRVVMTERLDASGSKQLRTDRLASGAYVLHVRTERGALPAVDMVVVH